MKKSLAYRTLQIAAAVAVYAAASVWASENHVEIVSQTITRINSLLVILAIALVFPYICFKALGKLYTPPASREREEPQSATDSTDNIQAEFDETWETMQYRGTRYKPEDLEAKSSNVAVPNKKNDTNPVIKYRGAIINSDKNEDIASPEATDNLSKDRQPQKSAQPKERMKYRGSYID